MTDNAKCIQYAKDIKIYTSGPLKPILINSTLTRISNWLIQHNFDISANKSFAVLFSS